MSGFLLERVDVKSLIEAEKIEVAKLTAEELGLTNKKNVWCKPVTVIPKGSKKLRKPRRPKRLSSSNQKNKIKKPRVTKWRRLK